MHKLWASIQKESTLLIRDLGALVILFVMPLVLVMIVTVVQDDTYRSLSATRIPIVLVDQDQGDMSDRIRAGLVESGTFDIVDIGSEEEAGQLVLDGEYQMAIILPEGLSSGLNSRIQENIDKVFKGLGIEAADEGTAAVRSSVEVRLYFDPVSRNTFKEAVGAKISQMVSDMETDAIYGAFQGQMSDDPEKEIFDRSPYIGFKEVGAGEAEQVSIPNSVQHNVPAWTLFAIFFIMLPLSINMVKEKGQRTFVRLRTLPTSYLTVLMGKAAVYLVVSLIQFSLMLLIGISLFPLIGLPRLEVSGGLYLLFFVAACAGLAAIGIGLLLGTVSRSPEQSAPFGATLVVILAALGGVWIPVFAMPAFMQPFARISPMNWGLNAFHDVFLRQGSFSSILPEVALLLGLFIITTLISIAYYERQNAE